MNAIEEKELTLYEAIEHAEERARSQRAIAKNIQKNTDGTEAAFDACMKCAANHEQLATWLKELAEYRAADLIERNELLNLILNEYFGFKATGIFKRIKGATACFIFDKVIDIIKGALNFKLSKTVIFYRCDHQVEKCKNSITCGGEDCNLTGDITHAVNFKRQESHDGTVYFVEKANNDQSEV